MFEFFPVDPRGPAQSTEVGPSKVDPSGDGAEWQRELQTAVRRRGTTPTDLKLKLSLLGALEWHDELTRPTASGEGTSPDVEPGATPADTPTNAPAASEPETGEPKDGAESETGGHVADADGAGTAAHANDGEGVPATVPVDVPVAPRTNAVSESVPTNVAGGATQSGAEPSVARAVPTSPTEWSRGEAATPVGDRTDGASGLRAASDFGPVEAAPARLGASRSGDILQPDRDAASPDDIASRDSRPTVSSRTTQGRGDTAATGDVDNSAPARAVESTTRGLRASTAPTPGPAVESKTPEASAAATPGRPGDGARAESARGEAPRGDNTPRTVAPEGAANDLPSRDAVTTSRTKTDRAAPSANERLAAGATERTGATHDAAGGQATLRGTGAQSTEQHGREATAAPRVSHTAVEPVDGNGTVTGRPATAAASVISTGHSDHGADDGADDDAAADGETGRREANGAVAQRSVSVEPSGAKAFEVLAQRAAPPQPADPAAPATTSGGDRTAPTSRSEATLPEMSHVRLAETLVAQARHVPRNGALELRFVLEPEELGKVRIQIESRGDELRVHIVTANGAATESLSAGLARLTAQLQEAGFRHADVTLHQQGAAPDGSGQDRREPDTAPRGADVRQPYAEAAGEQPTNPERAARLDLVA